MVKCGKNDSGKTDEHSLPALLRTRKRVNTIDFECPAERCKMNDCHVSFPLYHSKGKWWWVVLDKGYVETIQISPTVMKVRYTTTVPELQSCNVDEFAADEI